MKFPRLGKSLALVMTFALLAPSVLTAMAAARTGKAPA